jgi:class 3 adenylate cyclase
VVDFPALEAAEAAAGLLALTECTADAQRRHGQRQLVPLHVGAGIHDGGVQRRRLLQGNVHAQGLSKACH